MPSTQILLFESLDPYKLSSNFAIMSNLTNAIALLHATFDKYAGQDGDNKTLSKAELAELLRKELPFTEATDKAKVDNFFSMLDNDKDGLVDFTEYVTFVTALSVMCKGK